MRWGEPGSACDCERGFNARSCVCERVAVGGRTCVDPRGRSFSEFFDAFVRRGRCQQWHKRQFVLRTRDYVIAGTNDDLYCAHVTMSPTAWMNMRDRLRCMHAHVCTCLCTRIQTIIHRHKYTHACIHACMHACMLRHLGYSC